MNRVLVLGAGASVCAGYPTSSELLEQVGGYCSTSPLAGISDRWRKWQAFQEQSASDSLATLLRAKNPEIVLSALDLIEHRDADSLQELFGAARAADRAGDPSLYEPARAAREQVHRDSAPARSARHDLLACLEAYFQHMSCGERGQQAGAPLRKLLATLAPGDTVITFNWDTLAERALGGAGLWNPTTGYGVRVPLRRMLRHRDAPLTWLSPVQILKLHGSFGWSEPEGKGSELLLSGPYLLQHLDILLDGENCFLQGADEVDFDDPLVTFPTFLKLTPSPGVMQDIWWRAQQALASARQVEVWGYSLPPSDAAARLLFTALRYRLAAREVDIIVNDLNATTRDRWDELLGASVAQNQRLNDADVQEAPR